MSNTTITASSNVMAALESEFLSVSIDSMEAVRTAGLLAAIGHPEFIKKVLTAWEGREDALSSSILNWIEEERSNKYMDDEMTVVQRIEDAQEMALFLSRWEAAPEEIQEEFFEWEMDVEGIPLEGEEPVLECYRDKFPIPPEELLRIISNPSRQSLENVLERRSRLQAAAKAAPIIEYDHRWKRWLIGFKDGRISVRVSRNGNVYTVNISVEGRCPKPGAAVKFFNSEGHLEAIGPMVRPDRGEPYVYEDKAGHGDLPGGRWELLFFAGDYSWYLDPDKPDNLNTRVHCMDDDE